MHELDPVVRVGRAARARIRLRAQVRAGPFAPRSACALSPLMIVTSARRTYSSPKIRTRSRLSTSLRPRVWGACQETHLGAQYICARLEREFYSTFVEWDQQEMGK